MICSKCGREIELMQTSLPPVFICSCGNKEKGERKEKVIFIEDDSNIIKIKPERKFIK
jgi:DNA-directed RNA polymerase subunit RPC12/RpoP